MDHQAIVNSITNLSIRIDELGYNLGEIKELLLKHRSEEINRRLDQFNSALKDQSKKLDLLNAADITPVVVAPAAATTIKVAGSRKKRDDNIKEEELEVKAEAPEAKTDRIPNLINICEFFKSAYLLEEYSKLFYEKGVLTEEYVEKIRESNKEKLGKKKDEIVAQKTLAHALWKSLPDTERDIVRALKEQVAMSLQKKNSTEVQEEVEDA